MSNISLWKKLIRRDLLISVVYNPTLHVCYQSTQPKIVFKMNEAFLRYQKDNDSFDFTFRYVDADLNVDRQFNFNRRASETVDTFLKRVNVNLDKILNQKKQRLLKKKQKKNILGTEGTNVLEESNYSNSAISLVRNNDKISGDTPCERIFQDLSGVKLVINDSIYSIILNSPWVHSIALSDSILAGFPTYPSKFDAVYTDLKKSIFHWYKTNPTAKTNLSQVGEGYLYTPSVAEIGCKLKLKCLPKNDTQSGPEIEVESECVVEAGPGHCPFDTRHAFTQNKLTGKSFRITSYNILADTYSSTDYSKEVLFQYCPEHALNMDYRKQLIIKELLGFNSDIICLQEVDHKVYTNDLNPSLTIMNYSSVFNTKGEIREGLATFFNEQRFEKLLFNNAILSENKDLEKFSEIWSQITNEKVKTRFEERNTAVQVTVLKSKENPNKLLVVGNTHLYYHPDADHIRLLQGYYVLMYVDKIARKIKKENPSSDVSIIICGDFNSVPDCGIYQLMTENYIPENYKDWRSNVEEVVDSVSLSHELRLGSACGTPEYTNYTPTFAGCLDYIFYQKDDLEVEQVIPMPSNEELALYQGCPSVVFPSDHISLCADLRIIYNLLNFLI